MANATNKQSDPGARRGIFGLVIALNIHDHRCTIALKDHGKKLGNGILDTEKLEARLEGVSGLDSFIGKAKLLIVAVIPLTPERSRELNWSSGTWEVVGFHPRGTKAELPSNFKTRGDRERSFVPSMDYCKQRLSSNHAGLRSRTPKEKTALILHSISRLLNKWDHFPIEEFYNVLQRREEFADVIAHFGSIGDLRQFLKAFPQYFKLVENDSHLVFPRRFSKDEFKSFLAKGRRGERSRTAADCEEYVVVSDVQECSRQVRRLQTKAKETNNLILAIDCEGVNLGKEGPLTLLQIGTEEGEVFVFDVLATPDPSDMFIGGGLKALLEDSTITKVAYTTIWEQCHIFKGPYRPKLALLLEIFGLTAEHKTDEFAELVHDKQLFGKRPLTREMIEYAADDVLCLIPVIHESLDALISPLWRPHYEQKVAEALAESRIRDPHQMYEPENNQ